MFVGMRLLQGVGAGSAGTIATVSAYDYIPSDKMDRGIGYLALSSSLISALTGTFSVGSYNRSGPVPLVIWSVASLVLGMVLSLFVVFRTPKESKKFKISEVFKLNELFEKRALKLALMSALSTNLAFGLRGFIILYGRSLGFANPGWFTTVSAGGLILVRLAQDAMPSTEKTPRRRIYVSYAVFIAYLIVVAYCQNLIMFFGAALLWSVVYGVLNPQIQAETIKSVPLERRGAAGSTFLCSADIGVIIGSTAGGFIADNISYRAMFLLTLIPVAFSVIFYAVFIDRSKRKAESSFI